MFHFFLGEKHPSCPGESWDVSSFKYNLSLFGSLSNNAISGSDTNCLTTAFYKGAFLSFITEQCILQIAFVQIAGQSFKLRSRSSPGGSGPEWYPLQPLCKQGLQPPGQSSADKHLQSLERIASSSSNFAKENTFLEIK